MPVTVTPLDDGIGLELMSTGIVTGQEVIAAYRKICNPECLTGIKYEIIDRSQCTEYRITTAEVAFIAQQNIEISNINDGITILFIAPSDLRYGVTRIWQVFSEASGFSSLIFQDRNSAEAYIADTFL